MNDDDSKRLTAIRRSFDRTRDHIAGCSEQLAADVDFVLTLAQDLAGLQGHSTDLQHCDACTNSYSWPRRCPVEGCTGAWHAVEYEEEPQPDGDEVIYNRAICDTCRHRDAVWP